MRIGVVHSYYASDQPSGENVVVRLQIDALRAAGHEVAEVGASTDELSAQRGYAARTGVRVALGRGVSPLEGLRDFAPDVVHVHNLFPNIGDRWLDRWDGPVVATMHNYRTVCAAGSLHRDGQTCTLCPDRGSHHALAGRCYRGSVVATAPLAIATRDGGAHSRVLTRADRLVFLSARARDRLVGACGPTPRGTAVVPNFVEERTAAPDLSGSADAPQGRYWVYVGRLAPEKGALALAERWNRSETLYFLGDGPERSAIDALSAVRSVAVLGRVDRDLVASAVAGARGLLFPSLWEEPAPAMSYVEALASGTPTLTTQGHAVGDDVAAHGTGVTVASLAELDGALATLEEQRDRLGARARERFLSGFTEDTWLRAITSVYEDVLS